MPVRVVDASVIAAWCFREPRAADALQLIQGFELHAPLLLAYELTSIARRKAITYPETVADICEALQIALNSPIHWSIVDHVAVLNVALDTKLTTYDASYLLLARTLGVPLITFDRQLEKAVQIEI